MRDGSLRRCRLLAAAALAGSCLALTSFARADETWTGNNSTDWFTGGNWSTAVPTSSDNVIIDTTSPNPTVIDGASGQAATVTVGSSSTGNLTIQNGGTLSATSSVIGQISGSTGVLTVDGVGSSLTTSSGITVGQAGDGTLTIQNGGSVSAASISAATNTGTSATLTIDGTGSSLTTTGNFTAGVYGTTTVKIQNGASFTDYRAYLGTASTAGPVTVTVDGAGSTWTSTDNVYIGQQSAATLTIQNGGAVSAGGTLQVGYTAAASGTINIGAASGQAAAAPGTLSAVGVHFGSGTGTLVFNHTDSNYTFDLPISGAGSVEVDAGTTKLTGTNTYTGGTTINGGTLQIGDGGTVGSITGDVTSKGTLVFDRSDTFTFGGVISDNGSSGAVEQNGTGTTILTGDNTYTGGTTISAGTLQIGNGGTTGSISGNVTNNATLVFNRSDAALTLGGDISGTGALHQDGTGTTTLTGINTYSGGTTINTGTLQIGAGGTAGSITGNVTDDGTLAFNRSDAVTFAGLISGTGAVQQSGAGTTSLSGANTYTGGTTISAGTLQIGAGGTTGSITGDVTDNGALAFNRSDAVTFAGAISGSGALQQNGTGDLILSGSNTYTGATTVNAGTLSVNGSIASSAVTVNSGGILGGDGTVGPATIASGGALAPGNSIGTVTVSGNLTFNAGSSYNVQVSPSAADRTNVTGSATLAGTVNASYAVGSYTAKQYTIINATGGVSGTFSALTNSNLPSTVNAALSYDANDVYLDLALNFNLPSSGLDHNQSNVATALTDYFNSNGGIPTVFTHLTAAGLRQVSGEAGASLVTPMVNDNDRFIDAVVNGAFDGGLGDDASAFAATDRGPVLGYAQQLRISREAAEAYAAVMPIEKKPYNPVAARWHTWASIYHANGRVAGDSTVGSSATTSRAYGVAAGASYRMAPDTMFGFAMGGAGTNFSLDDDLGSGKTDVFHAAFYGRHNFGQTYVAGLLGYGWYDASTDRTVTVAGTDTLHAGFKASSFVGRAEAGYRFAGSLLDVTPYGAVQLTAVDLPAYRETATSGSDQFALSYAARHPRTTRTELGVRLAKAFAMTNGILRLKGRAAWAHDSFSGQGATATFQSLPGATFTVNGARPAADGALVSAGVDYGFADGWLVAASFDGEFSRTTASYAEKATIRYRW